MKTAKAMNQCEARPRMTLHEPAPACVRRVVDRWTAIPTRGVPYCATAGPRNKLFTDGFHDWTLDYQRCLYLFGIYRHVYIFIYILCIHYKYIYTYVQMYMIHDLYVHLCISIWQHLIRSMKRHD